MRDAPSLALITALQDGGATIRAYDPEGIEQAKALLQDVTYATDAYDCAKGADAIVIVTEWDLFRALDFARLKALMKTHILVDLRNIFRPEEAAAAGFSYVDVGRSTAPRTGA